MDLELDVFRYRDSGVVTVEDRDEFEDARRAGVIDTEAGDLAEQTTRHLERVLGQGSAPWLTTGWSLLETHAHDVVDVDSDD